MGKILVVDDHPQIVRLIQMALESDGHTVTTAANGLDALKRIQADLPDVMILDVVMPELDGIRVLHRVRADPATRELIVVMLTIHANPEDISLATHIGADYYLTKPFSPGEVTSLIRRILLTRKAE